MIVPWNSIFSSLPAKDISKKTGKNRFFDTVYSTYQLVLRKAVDALCKLHIQNMACL